MTLQLTPAGARDLDEVAIAKHPVLFLSWLMRNWPSLGWRVLKWIGPKRVRSMKEGKGGYSIGAMLGGKKND